ncbi:hypothetical protein BASA61_009634 [Batrachochytrium salamandrivorans]|nr:hypothetical protein BASA61_009634 [Batrachochytrium salamandrivorans]
MGAYVAGKPEGIRSHPYTTDMKVNPWTYGDLKTLDEVHDVGEVWASLLWEVYWSLVTKHGFSANLHDAKHARDAIVAADASYYKGANKCEILKAFAKRGLGSKATSSRKSDFSVPSECDGNAPSPDPTTTTTDTPSPDPTTTTTDTPSPDPTATTTDTPSPDPTNTDTTEETSTTTTKETATTTEETATATTEETATATKRSRTTSRAP